MHPLSIEFEQVKSQSAFNAFVNKYGLVRQPTSAGATYSAQIAGATVVINERWWDPSSVYAPQPDKHEAQLSINGSTVAKTRFQEAT